MGSAIYSRDSRVKNVPSPQEECVNVEPAYFLRTHCTGNEGILPLKPVSVRTRKFQYLEYVIVT